MARKRKHMTTFYMDVDALNEFQYCIYLEAKMKGKKKPSMGKVLRQLVDIYIEEVKQMVEHEKNKAEMHA